MAAQQHQEQEEHQEILRFPHLKVNKGAAKEEGIRRVRDKVRGRGAEGKSRPLEQSNKALS